MIAVGKKLFLIVICGWFILRAVTAIVEIIVSVDWQKNVKSFDRATVWSIREFVLNIIYIPMAFVFGAFSDKWGLFNTFFFITIFPAIFLLVLFLKKVFRGK